MPNLNKERFIGYIVLKRSLQMALISGKVLVCNKLARQNIFCFINSVTILVVLTYCDHYSYSWSYCYYYFYYYYYSYYYYYYHYYFNFIVTVLVLSILFISLYFILSIVVHITMTFV